MPNHHHLLLLLLLLLLISLLRPLSAVDHLFNGFSPSDLLLYGDASVPPSPAHRHLSLTNSSHFSIGRALLPSKLRLTSPDSPDFILPFSTSFIFSISPVPSALPGHGLALLFSPLPGLRGSTAAQHLGLFNRSTDADPSNGVLAVEFDVFENEEFRDIDDNHVGIDIFSLTSNVSHTAGYWLDDDPSSQLVPVTLNSGSNLQAWIDYANSTFNVTLAPVSLGRKPRQPLISVDLDLSKILQPEMYVGFCAATGKLVENHRILAWSFSNSNLSLSDALITSNLPNFIPAQTRSSSNSKALIAGVSSAVLVVFAIAVITFLVLRRRGKSSEQEKDAEAPIESWEMEYWPHRIGYEEIAEATNGFDELNLIGSGGNGQVYKGVLAGETVAVKRFHRCAGEEARGFLAEVSSLGRLRHRNLVTLKGWCRRGDDLILVYEYMENGSLERRLFGEGEKTLDWKSRVRILRDVAAGVLYLHEGWENRVVHRDIKASNVMLDGEMVGRLGDFGLARVQARGVALEATKVVGTAGYMAPEVVRSGKAGPGADVYAFGVLALEVVSGRRAVEEGRGALVEWAWAEVEGGREVELVDGKVRGGEGYEEEEGRRMVRVGVWCTCQEEAERPPMREVVRALEGEGGNAEAFLAERLKAGMGREGEEWSAAHLQCCYRSALGLVDPEHRHPTWEELGLSSSASLSGHSVLEEGR